jgi:hypothetical protein
MVYGICTVQQTFVLDGCSSCCSCPSSPSLLAALTDVVRNDRDLKNIVEFLQEKLLITGSFQQKFYKFVHELEFNRKKNYLFTGSFQQKFYKFVHELEFNRKKDKE